MREIPELHREPSNAETEPSTRKTHFGPRQKEGPLGRVTRHEKFSGLYREPQARKSEPPSRKESEGAIEIEEGFAAAVSAMFDRLLHHGHLLSATREAGD